MVLLNCTFYPISTVLTVSVNPRSLNGQSASHISDLTRERFDRMINEVEEYAFIILDLDGQIASWNKGAERIKGYRAEEAIGKTFRIFYTPEDRKEGLPDRLLREVLDKGKVVYEGWRMRKDGSRFWGNVTLTLIHDANNRLTGILKVTKDLTERKRAEDRLAALLDELRMSNEMLGKAAAELTEKNHRLTLLNEQLHSFAYVVSHDLQEPLRKIITFSLRQLEGDKSKEDILRFSMKIGESATRMRDLMQDLLRYAELNGNINAEVVDLNEIVEAVASDMEIALAEKNCRLQVDRLPVILGIRSQFTQVFLNLFGNAVKFSDPLKPLEISVSYIFQCRYSEAAGDGAMHVIRVTDNGTGFEAAKADKLFDMFYRGAPYSSPGIGMGLSIVKKVMNNHGGRVKAEGRPGLGATITLEFPEKQQGGYLSVNNKCQGS